MEQPTDEEPLFVQFLDEMEGEENEFGPKPPDNKPTRSMPQDQDR